MLPYKIVKYDPKNKYGINSSLDEYQHCESEVITITHSNKSANETWSHWLETYGLVSFAIESKYTEQELKTELGKRGYKFSTKVILKYYNKLVQK